MIKKLLYGFSLFCCFIAKSQVGVNTPTPRVTLDISGRPTELNKTDGIIIPTISKSDLAKKSNTTYTNNQNGVLVFVNDITNPTGTPPSLSQVSKVNSVGFYYFNGSTLQWNPIDNDANIYLNDGTLAGNRIVSQGSNTLAFTGTASNAFSVDGSTFSVNAANDNVGIGTTTPNTNAKLEVNASDKGFLVPRVALTSTNSASPLSAHVVGMEVYNTATNTATAGQEVFPGKYINNGNKWIRLLTSDDNQMVFNSNGNDLTGSITIDVPTFGNTSPTVNVTNPITFQLNKPSFVEFNGNISTQYGTTTLTDGRSRGAIVYWAFTSLPTAAINQGYSISRQYARATTQYANSATTGTSARGDFTATPTGKYFLPAGDYTVQLRATGIEVSGSYRITLGTAFDSASVFVTSAR